MTKIIKKLSIALVMAVLVVSFSIPFMLFPSKVYAADYTVGQIGPAGGIIFYDKGIDSDGWRYLEAAPSDINVGEVVIFAWSNITDSAVGGLTLTARGTAIGTGRANTDAILNQSSTAPAALACESLSVRNVVTGITYSDWFLPSKNELNLMYTKLKAAAPSLGDFDSGYYWSSSESGPNSACLQNFIDGNPGLVAGKNSSFRVRAVRAFSVTAAEQAAPTGLAGVAPTTYGGSDGKITGTTTTMEYKLASDGTYTACSATETTVAAAGNYVVRLAAKADFNAGVTTAVTVPAYEAPATTTTTEIPASSTPPKPLTPEEQASLDLSIKQQADLYGKDNIGFTKMLYGNILGRAAESEGLNGWVADLNNKMTPNDVVYNFVFSKELNPIISPASPEKFITFLYKNVFNREQDSEGYDGWLSAMKNGMSKEDVLLHFTEGVEFKNICEMFGLKIS